MGSLKWNRLQIWVIEGNIVELAPFKGYFHHIDLIKTYICERVPRLVNWEEIWLQVKTLHSSYVLVQDIYERGMGENEFFKLRLFNQNISPMGKIICEVDTINHKWCIRHLKVLKADIVVRTIKRG